ARQHGRLLPALSVAVGAADQAARAGHAVGDAALLAAVRRRALCAVPDHRGPLRPRHGPADGAVPGDLPALVRVLDALRGEPVPAAGAGVLRAHLARPLVVGQRRRGAGRAGPPGGNRADPGTGLAPLPGAGPQTARISATAA